MSVEGKVLITGASSGIGEATARALLAAGFEVWASARQPASLDQLRELGCRVVALDVDDDASVAAALAEVGPLEVVVNNAGYAQNGALEVLTMEEIKAQFETNVFGVLRVTRAVLPAMRARGRGRIINVGSIGGTFAAPFAGAYHMSKFAVEALSDALRNEVAPFGVDVVLVQPTGVATPFVDRLLRGFKELPADHPYGPAHLRAREAIRTMFGPRAAWAGIVTADQVARTIVRAAKAHRPRTRYRVGLGAHLLAWLRWTLPDRWFDRIARAAVT